MTRLKVIYSELRTTIPAALSITPSHTLFWLLSSILLFAFLGSREIWTQEWRWGEIVRWMLLHQDYFHPTLAGQIYFDKPLPSYWLMLAMAKLTHHFSTWTIRLPSAIAGLISIACLYQIGKKWQNPSTGALAALMLLTTYYFLFWARTASSDILNLAGILAVVAWYFSKREQPNLKNYIVFFLLLAVTALLKGLIGIIIVFLVIFPDIVLHLKKHLQWSLLLAILPGFCLYFLPFWITGLENHTSLIESGLYEVYRENILRFFEPFDHKDPFYTYFIYLPIYLLPWTFFLFPTLYQLPKRWATLSLSTKQLIIVNISLFIFLTISGSRRSYYVLPMVPFSLLFIAEWITSVKSRIQIAYYTASASFLALFIWFIVLQPLYYSDGGLVKFSQQLTAHQVSKKNWRIAFFNADNRLSFYLPNNEIDFLKWEEINISQLFEKYDVIIMQKKDLAKINNLPTKQLLFTEPHRGNRWLDASPKDAPVAVF